MRMRMRMRVLQQLIDLHVQPSIWGHTGCLSPFHRPLAQSPGFGAVAFESGRLHPASARHRLMRWPEGRMGGWQRDAARWVASVRVLEPQYQRGGCNQHSGQGPKRDCGQSTELRCGQGRTARRSALKFFQEAMARFGQ